MIDKNEAPKGYYAVACKGCNGCIFQINDNCTKPVRSDSTYDCCSGLRNDATSVIFVKKPTEEPVEDKGISGILNINVSFTGAYYNVSASFNKTYGSSSSPCNKQDISKQYLLNTNVTEDTIKKAVTNTLQNLLVDKEID